jgi:hypothetical protein
MTGMMECEAQVGTKKTTTACVLCSVKKIECAPAPDWAVERERVQKAEAAMKAQAEAARKAQVEAAKKEAAKSKITRRRSTAGWFIALSLYFTNHLSAMKEDASTSRILDVLQANQVENRTRFDAIEKMLRDLTTCLAATTGNRLPPVPPFDAPSPAVSAASAASAASNTSGLNVTGLSRMSLGSPSIAGPSRTDADESDSQCE